MSRAGSVRIAWRVLRAEGAPAVRDRVLDRLAEARRRRSFSPAPAGPGGYRPEVPVPVLNLSATPPAPRLGGVQAQLLARIEAEAEIRPLALLYPAERSWHLEIQEGARRRVVRLPGTAVSRVSLEDASFEEVVREAVGIVGASAVHVEGLAALPLGSLLRLGRAGLRLVLSLHDFAAFCARPHLLEQPALRFCEYSRDLVRCGRCLREDWPVEDAFQGTRREIAAELLAAAEALIFPSDFLRQAYRDLFPGLSERQHVIAPGLALSRSSVARGSLQQVALVGGVQAHKGALVFEDVVRRLAGEDLRWSAYGGGDLGLLLRLRRLGVRVRGYYRSGTLPGLLHRGRVDLALLLSIVPESYGLVLDECGAAGVPVLAFDLGALGERVPRLGAGRLVPLGEGAEGVVRALREMIRRGDPPEVRPEVAGPLANARTAAAAYLDLYRELGLGFA